MRDFLISQTSWPIGQISRITFRALLVVLCGQNLSLCIPVRNFALLIYFSAKNLRFSYILQDYLYEFGIWFWAVDNSGFSHHVFVVRVSVHVGQTIHSWPRKL